MISDKSLMETLYIQFIIDIDNLHIITMMQIRFVVNTVIIVCVLVPFFLIICVFMCNICT